MSSSLFEVLFNNGFTQELISVIPPEVNLLPGSKVTPEMCGKVPGRKMSTNEWSGGWVHADSAEEAQRLGRWGANVGIETTRIIPIDFDVNDKALHQPLVDLARSFFGDVPVRYGRRPLVFMRMSGPCTIGRLKVAFRAGDAIHKVETFFGPLKQFVISGLHPSGTRYVCQPIAPKLRYDAIPETTQERVLEFFQQMQGMLESLYDCEYLETTEDALGDHRDEMPDQADLIAPISEVAEALQKIPNNKGRDRWVELCHAIKGATQDNPEEGKQLWLDWCETREDGDPHLEEAERVWDSAGRQAGGLFTGFQALLSIGGLYGDKAVHDFADAPMPENLEPAPTIFRIQPVHARPLMRPEWVVRNILPAGKGLGVIYGAPGSNKSTVATSLAAHIALGIPFAEQPVKQGYVLQISEEDAVVNRRRLTAWEAYLAQKQKDGMALPENWRDMLRTNILETYPFFGHISKKKVKHAAEEIKRATNGQGVKCVFVDTLARTFVEEGEENEAKDMNKYIDLAESLADALACPVIVIHHPPKNADTLRGHGSLLGAVSMVFKVERTSDGLVRFYCQKMREAPEFEPIAFERKSIDISFAVQRTDEEDTQQETALVLQHTEWCELPTGNTRPASAGQRASGEEGGAGRPSRVPDLDILRAMIFNPGASVRSLSSMLGFASDKSLRTRLERMEEFHQVQRVGSTWEVTEEGQATFQQNHPDGILM